MRSSTLMLLWAVRDWDKQGGKGAIVAASCEEVMCEFTANLRQFLTTDVRAEPAVAFAIYTRCLTNLRSISALNEQIGVHAGYGKGGEGGLSRTLEFIRSILTNLESLRAMKDYSGTPQRLRYFCALMAYVTPMLLAPYWRHYCELEDLTCAPGYYACALYCSVLGALYTVFQDLESVFDMDGMDDLHFNQDLELQLALTIQPQIESQKRTGPALVRLQYQDLLGRSRWIGSRWRRGWRQTPRSRDAASPGCWACRRCGSQTIRRWENDRIYKPSAARCLLCLDSLTSRPRRRPSSARLSRLVPLTFPALWDPVCARPDVS
jgi:hypothetical protein